MMARPCYEFRCYEKDEWQEISEIEIMNGLHIGRRREGPRGAAYCTNNRLIPI